MQPELRCRSMSIHSLLPSPGADVHPLLALADDDRPTPDDRPWILANMVSSLDGATAINGVSGALGGPDDKEVFRAIRSVADVILVGASTVREETYRPPQPAPDVVTARRAAGRADRPIIAVVTSSMDLELDHPLFSDPSYRPLILSVRSAPSERREKLSSVADIIDVGDERADLALAVRELHERGHRQVLSEGGPSLNGQLIAADLIDEWNLTLSPLLAAGDSSRAAHGRDHVDPTRFRLARLWQGGELLFGRWVRAGS